MVHLAECEHTKFLYTSAFTVLLPLAEKSPTDASVSLTLAAIHVQDIRDPALCLTDKLACFRLCTVSIIILITDKVKCRPTSWRALLTCSHRRAFLHYVNVKKTLVLLGQMPFSTFTVHTSDLLSLPSCVSKPH